MKSLMLASLICTLLSPTFAQPEPKGGPTKSITVDGKKMTVYTQGLEARKPGQPVVIFENGMGITLNNFDGIFEEVAKFTPFVAYDRTGIGKSENDGQLPTLKHNSERLKRLLTIMKVAPPYLFIGHSMGGIYARGYAIYYPEDLAGLIFLDPGDFTETRSAYNDALKDIGRTSEQIERFTKNRLQRPKVTLPADTAPVREGQVLADLRWTDWKEITDTKLPNIPIQFIIGGKFSVAPPLRIKEFDHETYFHARQVRAFERFAKITGSSPFGKIFFSSSAGHYVHLDDPLLVISCIRIALADYQRLADKKE